MVEQFRRRDTEDGRRPTGMQPRTNNTCTSREANQERIGPGSNDQGRVVIDEDNVDAGVRKNTMGIFAGADNYLLPNAEKVISKGCRDGEFPILRKN